MIIPDKVNQRYLQRRRCRSRVPGLGQCGQWVLPMLPLGKAACTALRPVVFILAIRSEGRRKSPKEWLVAGSK